MNFYQLLVSQPVIYLSGTVEQTLLTYIKQIRPFINITERADCTLIMSTEAFNVSKCAITKTPLLKAKQRFIRHSAPQLCYSVSVW